jgi:hypothetical protein
MSRTSTTTPMPPPMIDADLKKLMRTLKLGRMLDTLPRAAGLGGTSTTGSPAASSRWASSRPSPLAPSIAQLRFGQRAAQSSNAGTCLPEADTRTCPSRFSLASSANAVCERLCGSIPITTPAIRRVQQDQVGLEDRGRQV